MPNAAYHTGSPLIVSAQGFDKPDELLCVLNGKHIQFFGTPTQVVKYVNDTPGVRMSSVERFWDAAAEIGLLPPF